MFLISRRHLEGHHVGVDLCNQGPVGIDDGAGIVGEGVPAEYLVAGEFVGAFTELGGVDGLEPARGT